MASPEASDPSGIRPSLSLNWTGIAAAVAGLILFAVVLSRTGLDAVAESAVRLGWGFGLVLALAGYRLFARAWAWTLCTGRGVRLPLGDAFQALLVGDALGNLTPLSLLVSEPTKAVLVRHRVPLLEAVASIAIENVFYTLSVASVIALGTAALVLAFDLPDALFHLSIAALVAMAAVVLGVAWLLVARARILTTLAAVANERLRLSARLQTLLAQLTAVEEQIVGFASRRPGAVPAVAAIEVSYHVAALAEVYVLLYFIVGPENTTLLTAFVLEAANRFISAAFKFVPLRLGVDEAGTGLLTEALGLGIAPGVAFAVLRKARSLCWSAVGVAVLAGKGLRSD